MNSNGINRHYARPEPTWLDTMFEMTMIAKAFQNEIEELPPRTYNKSLLRDEEENDEKILKWIIGYDFLII